VLFLTSEELLSKFIAAGVSIPSRLDPFITARVAGSVA